MLSKEEIEKAKEWLNWMKKEDLFLPYISNIIQYIDQLEQYLERISKQLDNVAIDQIPIEIAELQFKYKSIEQENNKQNKIIDEMAKELEELKLCRFKREDGGELLGKYRCYNKQDWKQYFEKKVEEK